ncbi:MAG: hypothetical protein LBT46_15370 [Planctomycetaceae bacterium]|jgi:hypothetical protein|nr:hypothetical protein [Planctomycetaceae bacterium]
MSNDTLNGKIGQEPHYYGDYVFNRAALPNNATVNSNEFTLNNTNGALKIRGYIDAELTLTSEQHLTLKLQYKDSAGDWQDDATVLSSSNATIGSVNLFEVMPVPSTLKRVFRLQMTADFDASAVHLTAPIEYIPR